MFIGTQEVNFIVFPKIGVEVGAQISEVETSIEWYLVILKLLITV